MAPTNTNDWVESTVEVEVQPTHTLGLTLNTQTPPKITKLLPSSCFLGKLFVGDLILSINGEPVKTMADFFRLSRAANRLAIRLKRDEYCTVRISKATATRPNCDAFDFELMWRSGGMPIGILVYQDSEKRVIVSMIESGTLASTTLRPGDILTKVNDTPVSGKHDAKKLIIDSVNAKNRVKLTVERAQCTDTCSSTSKTESITSPAVTPTATSPASQLEKSTAAKITPPAAPAVNKLPNFDLPLPADVLAILQKNRTFFRQPCVNPPILRNSAPNQPANGSGSHINLPLENTPLDEQQIEFDPGQKALRPTPKRVGSA